MADDNHLKWFGERLRCALAVANLTRADLARTLIVSTQAVTKWTTGQCSPRSSHLVEICRLTGCSLEWIMAGEPVDIQSPSKARKEHLASVTAGKKM